jgi:hypothetical protein
LAGSEALATVEGTDLQPTKLVKARAITKTSKIATESCFLKKLFIIVIFYSVKLELYRKTFLHKSQIRGSS